MSPDDVTACLVTRGNISMKEIRRSLIFPNVVIWDNKRRPKNLRTYGRYMAAYEAETPVIYVQDDDTIISPEAQQALLDAYTPGVVVANQPANYQPPVFDGLVVVGWGAIFDRDLVPGPSAAFYNAGGWGRDDVDPKGYGYITVGCDILFTMLNETRTLDLGRHDRPEATGIDRVYRDPNYQTWKWHYFDLARELGAGPSIDTQPSAKGPAPSP